MSQDEIWNEASIKKSFNKMDAARLRMIAFSLDYEAHHPWSRLWGALVQIITLYRPNEFAATLFVVADNLDPQENKNALS